MKSERPKLNMTRAFALAAAALSLVAVAQAAPNYKVLYNFTGSDGAGPYGGVIVDRNGNLYGTTSAGGTGSCRVGCGTVFELIPQGGGKWTEAVLHNFNSNGDGYGP
jgi:uncharacterized repeat protein (TIGR03803 family)